MNKWPYGVIHEDKEVVITGSDHEVHFQQIHNAEKAEIFVEDLISLFS